ncbi:MAG: preprotein translocase subunit SecG, partial [Oscillospiraceae bacterium]
LLIVCCILIVIVVSVQSGKGSGLTGAIMGSDTSASGIRGRGRDTDAKLASMTKILAIVLFAITLGVSLVFAFSK